ncbi:MAG: FtsX-like permease family protein [Bacteroidales bacterium]|nr:FtsX-like permease family protein [Bacteroidales bacterium]
MRKVAGATLGQLAWQFIGESFLLSLMALIVALALVELLLPVFSQMTGLQLETIFHLPYTLLMALALTIIVGFFAGTYPALVLSSFQPVRAIRGEMYQGMKKSVLRNLLVVLQFTISIALLVSTWLIYEQMQFVRNKNMGFDRENIVIIPLRSDRLKEKAKVFRDEMEQIPSVSMISLSSSTPGKMIDGIGYVPEGIDSKSPWIIYTLRADYRFTGVMGMEIREGRGFSPEYGTDSMATIINRALVNKLGWTNPVGKKIYHFGEGEDVSDDERRAYHVIGVVEDFHFKSLHDLIEPAMIILHSGQPNFLAVRLYPGNTGESVRLLREKWEELEQAIPFDHYFLGEAYDELYRPEQKMAQLFITFTILAMLIACLGLFGLALFSIEQRVKEIGIRKILGAGVPGLLYRLSREFSRWVVLSAVIAWPVAYLLVDNWLQSFAYRIEILGYAWVFILSGLAALAVALLTVIYQAYRAATRNPVEAVKYE